MAAGRKYAALPDLDAAPDTYETPELTDDNSTIPPSSLPRPESPASSQDETDEDVLTGISRRGLDPDQARSHFLTSGQESADPQYTGRIKSKRKSYKESGKRGRPKDAVGVGAETSSDEDEHSLEKKLARLRREVAEVKAAFERKKTQEKSATQPTAADGNSLEDVDQMLNSMDVQGSQTENGAASRLVKSLSNATKQHSVSAAGPGYESQPDSLYTFNYIPNYGKEHSIAKVAEFDARLTLLENALGIDKIALPTQPGPQAKAVLPTLANIDRQISIVSNSTDSTMDATNRRIRQLTQNAQRLTEARKSAKAAQEALSNSRSIPGPPIGSHEGVDGSSTPNLEDEEQISKINALYGTLPTIEALSPILPSLLDRLRSLRSVHAEAAMASKSLAQIESRQEAMAEDILSWRTGLEKVEGIFAEGQRTMGENMLAIEGWVKELEERMVKIHP
ncbi:ubiquinone biosynthesis monooxygenase [Physcia stellaris]|nr:ubiquinone biosynthesis monooxygenase [Physcia stellaris]